MVNICDTFTRMYGRAPTEAEIASMMKMKADIDAFKNKSITPREGDLVHSKKAQERAKISAARRNKNGSVAVPQRTCTINKLIMFGLSTDQIADALFMKFEAVESDIEKYKLPRQNIRKKK